MGGARARLHRERSVPQAAAGGGGESQLGRIGATGRDCDTVQASHKERVLPAVTCLVVSSTCLQLNNVGG